MKKLIELLNEWQQSFNPGYEFTYKYSEENARKDLNNLSQLKLFIKWLVENDKIDRDIMGWKSENMHGDNNFSRYERLLMILSISETPIDDLINYLK